MGRHVKQPKYYAKELKKCKNGRNNHEDDHEQTQGKKNLTIK